MRNLIAFIVKNTSWFLLILLEILCFYLIFHYNSYQRSVFVNSSDELVGRVYSVSGNVVSYFGLRGVNENLTQTNADLQNKILAMEDYINKLEGDSLKTKAFLLDSIQSRYTSQVVGVVNNSISQIDNYIWINKGSKEGIHPDMGVISHQGIVGIVRFVSQNYAVVQPVINPKTILSCKVKGTNAPGSLIWDGKDYQYTNLEGFPRFEKFQKGDTIITSGDSKMFPEGIMVGVVEDSKNQSNDNFLTLKVRLATDFASLRNVIVIKNRDRDELIELEKVIQASNVR